MDWQIRYFTVAMTEAGNNVSKFTLGFTGSAGPEFAMFLLVCGACAYLTHLFPSGWTALLLFPAIVGLMRVAPTEVLLKPSTLEIRGLGGLVRRRSLAYSDIRGVSIIPASWSPYLLVILSDGALVRLGPFDTVSFLGRKKAFLTLCEEIALRSGAIFENLLPESK